MRCGTCLARGSKRAIPLPYAERATDSVRRDGRHDPARQRICRVQNVESHPALTGAHSLEEPGLESCPFASQTCVHSTAPARCLPGRPHHTRAVTHHPPAARARPRCCRGAHFSANACALALRRVNFYSCAVTSAVPTRWGGGSAEAVPLLRHSTPQTKPAPHTHTLASIQV